MKKTFRIGDLVCYSCATATAGRRGGPVRHYDEFENGQFVGTIIGWFQTGSGQCAKIHWFDWFETGPTETIEYFSEIQLISGER